MIESPELRTRPASKPQKPSGCLWALAIGWVLCVALLFTPVPGMLKRAVGLEKPPEPVVIPEPIETIVEVEKVVEVEKIVEVDADPPPMPNRPVSYKKIDIAKLFNGIQIASELESVPGGVASVERKVPEAFQATFSLRVRVPTPNTSLAQLTDINPNLPKALVEMPALIENAKVSRYFYHLYDLKQRQVQSKLTELEASLSRHNFFDCDTVLELTAAESGRRAWFLQGEMDVVADGSDGDRMPTFSDYIASSTHFQPTTSYGWRKQTTQPNPLVARMEKKLAEAKERYKVTGLTRGENARLEYTIESTPRYIAELKARSFLIAQADPFVVLPLSTRKYLKTDPFIPKVGDYCVVIYEDRMYPAIVGDYGPTTKVGEASLRIAKELNENSSPYRRPVSDLSVSYLYFPGSAEKPFRAPDYDHWHERCTALLEEMGGIGEGYTLHRWSDPFAEPAPPASESAPVDPTDPVAAPPAAAPATE